MSPKWISRSSGPGWRLSMRLGNLGRRSPGGRVGPSADGVRPRARHAGRRQRTAGHAQGQTGVARGAGGRRILAVLGRAPPRGGPLAAVDLRDTAIMELLYATGIRVSELCRLDIDDVDQVRRLIRCSARAPKARGARRPACRAAVASWRAAGRPELARALSGPALFLGARGRRIDENRAAGGTPGSRAGGPVPARTACAYGGHAFARGRRGSAQRAGNPRTRLSSDHADLHACRSGG
jgi:hypothetical protein